jgi:hypothetical protein
MVGLVRSLLLPLAALLTGTMAASSSARLSDPIGIYGIVDKVVIQPDTSNPSTIQVWGVFALSENVAGDNYKPAQRGYLFFSIDPSRERQMRAEWSDLRSLAGSSQPVGFGAKYSRTPPRLRCPTETPANPDIYTTNIGLVKSLSGPRNANATSIEAQLKSKNVPTVSCPTK